jgi:hypothetical protein
VQGSAQLVSQDRLRVRLLVEVRIAAQPVESGLPGSSAAAAQVRLERIRVAGLGVRYGTRPPPVLLGYVGRFGSGLEQVVRLTVDVVALGCADTAGPPRLTMGLTRSTASGEVDGTVRVQDGAGVAEALEALEARGCA